MLLAAQPFQCAVPVAQGEDAVDGVDFAPTLTEKASYTVELPQGLVDASGRTPANANQFPLKVSTGLMPDVNTVFRHYLAKGKPGFVEHVWASLEEAVGWIRGAGGIAVV